MGGVARVHLGRSERLGLRRALLELRSRRVLRAPADAGAVSALRGGRSALPDHAIPLRVQLSSLALARSHALEHRRAERQFESTLDVPELRSPARAPRSLSR